jgi:predicted transcriptional regulator
MRPRIHEVKLRQALHAQNALLVTNGFVVDQELQFMMDVILLGLAVAFFAICLAYTRACDRL